MDEMTQEKQRQAMRQQIIEEERQKLLKEHATKLLGYMPKVISFLIVMFSSLEFNCIIVQFFWVKVTF